ncbi:MAG TPA: sigma-70 family RNA polymerase sigma factor [Planctomycetota bacterium]|nr:sigma-70 family RNA polymerase sigma factor [Planctomycetota bacterium]
MGTTRVLETLLTATPIETARDTQWVQDAVRLYHEPLTLYAVRLAGSVERGHDAVQETFVRLCQARREELEGHLKEWLFSVCRSRALDLKRKECRMIAMAEPEARSKPAEAEPLAAVERNETRALLAEHLHALPPNQQEVIRLKFQHGLSYKEISTVTGLTVSNVGFLMHTGIATLRAKMR